MVSNGIPKCLPCSGLLCSYSGCAVNSRVISVNDVVEWNGGTYHSICYATVRGRVCFACGDLVPGDGVATAMSTGQRLYHKECFKCGSCSRIIDDQQCR